MKSANGVTTIGVISILLLSATLLSAFGACFLPSEPMLTIQVHNQMDKTLRIFLDGETFVGDAIPDGQLKFKTIGILSSYRVVAKDLNGNVVFSARFTQEDLKRKRTYKIVIPPDGKDAEHSDNATGK